jgi:hypothetical protein
MTTRNIEVLRSDVFAAVEIHILIVRVMTPCGPVGGCQNFGGTYCRILSVDFYPGVGSSMLLEEPIHIYWTKRCHAPEHHNVERKRRRDF